MNVVRIAVDTGGTFTDFVVIRNGKVQVFKELSTPHNPAEAILKGLAKISDAEVKGPAPPLSMPI